jgi:hypothetical protein
MMLEAAAEQATKPAEGEKVHRPGLRAPGVSDDRPPRSLQRSTDAIME